MGWTTGSAVVDGARLHYHRTGGDKPVLLLLHGVTDSGLCWTRVARELEPEFDIVMPDARGHGLSRDAGSDVSVARLARDAAGLLDALGLALGAAGIPVWGHSMGAITAARLAADRPDLVRALVLEDPPLAASHFDPEFIRGWQSYLATWSTLTPGERRVRSAAENPGWHRLETDLVGEAKAMVDPAVLDHLDGMIGWQETFGRIACPGLLVTADPDLGAIVTPEIAALAAQRWPAATVVRIEGAGHCIHRDRWDEAMAVIGPYLRSIVAPSAGAPHDATDGSDDPKGPESSGP